MKFIFSGLVILSCCVFMGCGNDDGAKPTTTTPTIKQLSYTVTATFPHDVTSFTEGLEFHNGKLLESTGNHGKSKLAWVNIADGKDLQKIELAADFFGEGATLLNGKIYQLTYEENTCFVYDAATLKKLNVFTYEGEGWGLTNDGTNLIMSNGSDKIFYRNPATFEVVKTISVSNNYGPLGSINELEYVKGLIYANVWTTNKIVQIEASSGKVLAEANFDDLITKYAPEMAAQKIDVLNGIAYDSTQQHFYITGKYWPKLFQVKFN